MKKTMQCLPGLALAAVIAAHAHGGAAIDQDNLNTTSFGSGLAIISSQTLAQVVTVGTAGTLTQVDVQIWATPGTIGADLTVRILSTTAGAPDPASSGTLHSVVVPLKDVPVAVTFPSPAALPLTTVDVSGAGLNFDVGDQFAISIERVGAGAPPWVLWGTEFNYPGGDGYQSSGGESWIEIASTMGFRTWVDEDGGVPCPADLDGNGVVGFPDLLILLNAWGDVGVAADIDGGGVGFSDLLLVLAAWGPCP